MVSSHAAFKGSWKLTATVYTQQKGGQNAVASQNGSGVFKVMSLGFVDSKQKLEIHCAAGGVGGKPVSTAAIRKR